jgi:hypothetical protein
MDWPPGWFDTKSVTSYTFPSIASQQSPAAACSATTLKLYVVPLSLGIVSVGDSDMGGCILSVELGGAGSNNSAATMRIIAMTNIGINIFIFTQFIIQGSIKTIF